MNQCVLNVKAEDETAHGQAVSAGVVLFSPMKCCSAEKSSAKIEDGGIGQNMSKLMSVRGWRMLLVYWQSQGSNRKLINVGFYRK